MTLLKLGCVPPSGNLIQASGERLFYIFILSNLQETRMKLESNTLRIFHNDFYFNLKWKWLYSLGLRGQPSVQISLTVLAL